ncbi:MAG: hypothetical protein JXB48_02770 [Candidatus Latescibacteria bacterium]|nr:hypothetical protein [Candidatus Latescibacterota bacterium]
MREGVVEALGEPDDIESGGSGPYKYELYYYLNKDLNRVYEFRKSASGCGSSGNWYVESIWYADYHFGRELYEPPYIEHAEVKTATSGQALKISAIVTDDEHVISVDLFYKALNAADSLAVPIPMAVSDSTYSATLPASVVKAPGLEYYIEASDGNHKSKLPPSGFFAIEVTDAQPSKITTANKAIDRKNSTTGEPLPETLNNGSSPVGP